MVALTANDMVLPTPTVIKINNEVIWSSNTGRTSSDAMVSDVVVEKKAVAIEWGVPQESEMAKIRKNLITGLFPFVFNGGGGVDLSITSCRGTINEEHIGLLGDGTYWYKGATAKVIQQ